MIAIVRSERDWRRLHDDVLAGRDRPTLALLLSSGRTQSSAIVRAFEQLAVNGDDTIQHRIVDLGESDELQAAVASGLAVPVESDLVVLLGPGCMTPLAQGNQILTLSTEQLAQPTTFTVDALRLGRHLVGREDRTFPIVLRELLQNAADATFRIGEAGAQHEIQVDFTPDQAGFVLSVTDHGEGMSRAVFHDVFLRVASSLKEAGAAGGSAAEQRGFYGVGFLTALAISSRVRVVTKAAALTEPAIDWTWHENGQQKVLEFTNSNLAHGTRVDLLLPAKSADRLSPQTIRETVAKTAAYVPVPVYFGNEPQPCNDIAPPWTVEHPDRSKLLEFCASRGESSPIHVMLLDHGKKLPFRGLLFVPSRKTEAHQGQRPQEVDLYVGGLRVMQLGEDFLGPYNNLVGGVICDDLLSPNLIRDSAYRDEVWREHSKALTKYIEENLAALLQHRPDLMAQLATRFPMQLEKALTASEKLREATRSQAVFQTSAGNRPFDEIASGLFRGRPIVVSLPWSDHTLVDVVLRENGHDYVKLQRTEDLRLFAYRCQDIGKRLLLNMDVVAELVMTSLAEPLAQIAALLREMGVEHVFVGLRPAFLPAFAVRFEDRWIVALNTLCPQLLAIERAKSAIRQYMLTDIVSTSILISGRELDEGQKVEMIQIKTAAATALLRGGA